MIERKFGSSPRRFFFSAGFKRAQCLSCPQVFSDTLSCHLVFEVLALEQTVYISLKVQAVWKSILDPPSAPHVSAPSHPLSPH